MAWGALGIWFESHFCGPVNNQLEAVVNSTPAVFTSQVISNFPAGSPGHLKKKSMSNGIKQWSMGWQSYVLANAPLWIPQGCKTTFNTDYVDYMPTESNEPWSIHNYIIKLSTVLPTEPCSKQNDFIKLSTALTTEPCSKQNVIKLLTALPTQPC